MPCLLAIFEKYKVTPNFGIYECGSDDKVLRRMNALIAAPEAPSVIGVVLDTDEVGIKSRWQQINAKIEKYNYNIPPSPLRGGTILESQGGYPRLGVWLMPDNQQRGMLEDFLLELMDPDARVFTSDCVDSAVTAGLATFKEAHKTKSIVHTFLAWQDEPGKPLGQSVTSHALNTNHPLVEEFIGWINNLFNS